MGSYHLGVWALLLTCLILIPSWYGGKEADAKSIETPSEDNKDLKRFTKKKVNTKGGKGRKKKGKKHTKKGKGNKIGQKKKGGNKNTKRGFLFQGDMILTKLQLQQMKKARINGNHKHDQESEKSHRNAAGSLWPNNIVYYSFHHSVTSYDRNTIKNVLTQLQGKLSNCLTFYHDNTHSHSDRIEVSSERNVCEADLGYRGGLNRIWLRSTGCMFRRKIEHEFLHAIGIGHEHSREDRDEHIKIMNIYDLSPYAKRNYDKYKGETFGLPYDYYSVMHYDKVGLGEHGKTTIETRDPSVQNEIGDIKRGVSVRDIQLIQKMYQCTVESTNGRCYDSSPRSLPHVIHAGQDNSVEYCKARCYDAGFEYAGVEAWDWCFCGHYLPSNTLRKPSTECRTPCPADSTQFCGAGLRYNVFETNTGCDYRQLRVSAYNGAQIQSTYMAKFTLLENFRHNNHPVWKREGYNAYIYAGWFNHKLNWMMGSDRNSGYRNIYNSRHPIPSYPPVYGWTFWNWNSQKWQNDGSLKVKPTGAFCGRIAGINLEYLTSPNYPNNYLIYQVADAYFSVPEGHFIEIDFLNFNIEGNSRCSWDYLQFYDGNGRKHGIFCGETKPQKFIIPSSEAKLHFHSDYSETRQGYQLSYQAVKQPEDHKESAYFDLDGGYWGDWGYPQKCRYPHFVIAMELKIEDDQSWGKDDSALNAIRLTCSNGQTITSVQGGEGRWRGVQICPSETFMVEAKIRRESKQNGDDTAANGVRFTCTDARRSKFYTKYPGDGYWGSWTSYSYCEDGSAVIGLATQVERDQGSRDDTCMNDVRFYCAKLPHIQIIYPGSNSVRSQTRINLEETKEKKVPDMNTTQTTEDDTKIGRIANQINEDNTEMGRNSKQNTQDIRETNMNATQTSTNNSETDRSTNHTSLDKSLTGRNFNQTRVVNTKKDKNTNQTTLDNTKRVIEYTDDDQ